MRSPTVALPEAAAGGAGRIADQGGTGWSSLRAARDAPAGGATTATSSISAFSSTTIGCERSSSNADDWLAGAPTTRFSAFRGDTELASVYAQDTWAFAPQWRATLGVRVERWQRRERRRQRCHDDARRSRSAPRRYVSPKLAIARQLTPAVEPQGVARPRRAHADGRGALSGLDRGERHRQQRPESAAREILDVRAHRRARARLGSLRLTAFFEDTTDALYSQTNVTVTPNVTNIQNVDEIDTRGLEAASRAPGLLGDRLDFSASLTYAHSRIEQQRQLSRRASASGSRACPSGAPTRSRRIGSATAWSLTAGGRYSGTQFNTLDNSDPNGYAFTGTSAFVVFDLRARYANERWSASLGIDNVGDEEYWAFHPYTRRSLIAELGVELLSQPRERAALRSS